MARVPLGQVVITPAACDELATNAQSWQPFLDRHAQGDWGDLDAGDKLSNDNCLARYGCRLLSSYTLNNGVALWIITEADRSVTTILLPSDY